MKDERERKQPEEKKQPHWQLTFKEDIPGKFRWLIEQRIYPGETIPRGARRKALHQKRKMHPIDVEEPKQEKPGRPRSEVHGRLRRPARSYKIRRRNRRV
jgi:hypothetical protein